jgi:hypothetical protein
VSHPNNPIRIEKRIWRTFRHIDPEFIQRFDHPLAFSSVDSTQTSISPVE